MTHKPFMKKKREKEQRRSRRTWNAQEHMSERILESCSCSLYYQSNQLMSQSIYEMQFQHSSSSSPYPFLQSNNPYHTIWMQKPGITLVLNSNVQLEKVLANFIRFELSVLLAKLSIDLVFRDMHQWGKTNNISSMYIGKTKDQHVTESCFSLLVLWEESNKSFISYYNYLVPFSWLSTLLPWCQL